MSNLKQHVYGVYSTDTLHDLEVKHYLSVFHDTEVELDKLVKLVNTPFEFDYDDQAVS